MTFSEMRSALMRHMTYCSKRVDSETNDALYKLVDALIGLDERLKAGDEAMVLQALRDSRNITNP